MIEVKIFVIVVGEARTTGLLYPAPRARAAIVLAHGAGAPQTHPWMVTIARALSGRAFDVVTFNFLYAEAKRRVPDRSDALEATWRAVVAAVRVRDDVAHGCLYIGGKSMGGRIATQVAAGGAIGALGGLVLLGYPLHPPGKPHQLRAAHLPRVRDPMLFVQGSRDTFGTPDELEPIVRGLSPGSRLFVVEGETIRSRCPRARGRPWNRGLPALPTRSSDSSRHDDAHVSTSTLVKSALRDPQSLCNEPSPESVSRLLERLPAERVSRRPEDLAEMLVRGLKDGCHGPVEIPGRQGLSSEKRIDGRRL